MVLEMKIVQILVTAQKAESLIINSVGQRPTEWKSCTTSKPRRGVINLIINH